MTMSKFHNIADETTSVSRYYSYIFMKYSFGVLRADYFIQNDNCAKNVEINLISTSIVGISSCYSKTHRFVLEELELNDELNRIPENDALTSVAYGMIEAWKYFGNERAVILFFVEEAVLNICDQRFIEFEVNKLNRHVKIIRRTSTDLYNRAKLTERKELIIDGYTVAMVYFRTSYVPQQLPTEKDWEVRLLLERSTAVKCPTIQYHLAGSKKIQEVLTKPNVLEMFLSNPEDVDAIRKTFVKIYSLSGDEGEKAIELGIKNPEKYVLKPQREGGGNNIYGDEIKSTLLKLKNTTEREAWILMEKIFPIESSNMLIKPQAEPTFSNIVGELGIFGVIIGDKDNILVNRSAGHTIRSKETNVNEGGVSAGFGAISSPYLID